MTGFKDSTEPELTQPSRLRNETWRDENESQYLIFASHKGIGLDSAESVESTQYRELTRLSQDQYQFLICEREAHSRSPFPSRRRCSRRRRPPAQVRYLSRADELSIHLCSPFLLSALSSSLYCPSLLSALYCPSPLQLSLSLFSLSTELERSGVGGERERKSKV